MIESKAFNEYIEVYKKLSLKKKQDYTLMTVVCLVQVEKVLCD